MSSIGPKPAPLRLDPVSYENLRQLVLRRDGWRCQSCGTMSNLEVHHKQYPHGASSASAGPVASHVGEHEYNRVGLLHRGDSLPQRKRLACRRSHRALGPAPAYWWPSASFARFKATGRFHRC